MPNPFLTAAGLLTSDVALQLYTGADEYGVPDTDNRPLRRLLLNDVLLSTEHDALSGEVYAARTNADDPAFDTLKARLDSMDLTAGAPAKTIIFDNLYGAAATRRAQFGSGFFCVTGDVFDGTEIEPTWPQGAHSASWSVPFGAITVRMRRGSGDLSNIPANTVYLWNYHDSRPPHARPLEVSVAGFPVRLFDEGVGAPADGVSVVLPAPPSSSHRFDLAFLEVWFAPVRAVLDVGQPTCSFYQHGAVDSLASRTADPSDPSVRGTVYFKGDGSGDYIQIRHRIRVVADINAVANPSGMSDASVLAQGGAAAPVAGRPFTNALNLLGDPAVWLAGSGDADAAVLGAVDGHVYAIPVLIASRRNTAAWSLSNQNGGTGRPDGLSATDMVSGDIVDLRPMASTDRSSLAEAMEGTFDRILRGKLRTAFVRAAYDTTTWNTFDTLEAVYGTELLGIDYVGGGRVAGTSPVRDLPASGEPPTADPDGIRRVWSPSGDVQQVGFHVPVAGGATDPVALIAYNTSTHVLTISAGTNRLVVTPPVMSWRVSKTVVAISGSWAGIGTATAYATLDSADTNWAASGTVDGAVGIQMPRCSGTRHAPNRAVAQAYLSPTAVLTPAARVTDPFNGFSKPIGISVDAAGNMYICDTGNHRVIQYAPDGSVTVQFGQTGFAGADNTHLRSPTAVAVDAAGNVYVADTGNHRMVKLTSSLVYSLQFGTTGTPGADNASLRSPAGVSVDSSNNVYVSDAGNARVLKLNSSLAYVSQFGTTGVFGNDGAHLNAPANLNVGQDGNLYVADGARVLVLNPATMALLNSVVGGQSAVEGSATQVFIGLRTVALVSADPTNSTSDIYVAGGSTAAVYRFDHNFNLLARFGDPTTPWDGAVATSTTHAGASYSAIWDQTNNSLWLTDTNAGFSPSVSRILVLNGTDLTFKYQKVMTNPRPWMDGAAYPVSPTPAYPEPTAFKCVFDPTGRKLYIPLPLLGVVEKWSCPADDPAAWTYQAKFGTISNEGTHWTSWRNSNDNTTRLGRPVVCAYVPAVDAIPAYLFVGDWNVASATQISSRVSRINPASMAYIEQLGDLATLNSDVWPNMYMISGLIGSAPGGGITMTDAQSNPPRLIQVMTFDLWGGVFQGGIGGGAGHSVRTDPSWKSFLVDPLAFLTVCGFGPVYSGGVYNSIFVNPGDATQIWDDRNGFGRVPFGTSIGQFHTQASSQMSGASHVWQSGGVLLIADTTTNVVYAMDSASLYPIGRAGASGVSAFGAGGWAGVSGIAYDGTSIYFCDLYNSHLVKASKYFAFVERGSGRIETLFAPPASSQVRVYSRYTPYQGVIAKPTHLAESNHLSAPFFASNLLARPRRIVLTTRGRAGMESARMGGDAAYSSPLAHLPLPLGAGDEYSWLSTVVRIALGILPPTSLASLPIMQSGSESGAYEQDSESLYDPDTQLVAPVTVLARGVSSYTAAGDVFPPLRTFPSAQDDRARMAYVYAVFEYKGELLLLVRGDLLTGPDNGVALPTQAFPSHSAVVDLFRMTGRPFAVMMSTR